MSGRETESGLGQESGKSRHHNSHVHLQRVWAPVPVDTKPIRSTTVYRCPTCWRERRLEQKRRCWRANSDRYRANAKATGSYERGKQLFKPKQKGKAAQRRAKLVALNAKMHAPFAWPQPGSEVRSPVGWLPEIPIGMTSRHEGEARVVWQLPEDKAAAV